MIIKKVFMALNPLLNGDMNATFDTVCAKIARSKLIMNYNSIQQALILNGKFVLNQLKHMSEQNPELNFSFEETPFSVSLETRVK